MADPHNPTTPASDDARPAPGGDGGDMPMRAEGHRPVHAKGHRPVRDYRTLQTHELNLYTDAPEQLEALRQQYPQRTLAPGDILFREGDAGDYAYVVLDGRLDVVKQVQGRPTVLGKAEPGEIIGEMSLVRQEPRMATVRAQLASTLIQVPEDAFLKLLDTCGPAARAMLNTMLVRLNETEARLRQAEHISSWATLSAGVAHELNNPAAAIKRGVDQLKEALDQVRLAQHAMNGIDWTERQLALSHDLSQLVDERTRRPAELDALARADKEAAIEDWLSGYGINAPWHFSAALVNLRLTPAELRPLAEAFSPQQAQLGLQSLCASYTAYSLLAEIAQGAAQISSIVDALRGYAYLDQAPVQEVDVAEGIDNTLLILRQRIPEGVSVRRDYAPDLPPMMAYGRELNQVWTNILTNALDAVDPASGVIGVTARPFGEAWIEVAVEDNGPGIPDAIQHRLFDPFFTTKGVGEGTGLGLNVAYNIVVEKHHGEIKVESQPGQTVFRVLLPVNFEAVARS